MIRIVLFGARGRMGRLVTEEVVKAAGFRLVAGVEDPNHPDAGSSFDNIPILPDGTTIPVADVWVDFSLSSPALKHARLAAESGVAFVLAATGTAPEEQRELHGIGESIPLLIAANLSVGIGVLDRIAGLAQSFLGEAYDSAIVEKHHKTKRDAPSGTARRLAETLSSGGIAPQLSSIRAGGVFGEHQVHFVGADEELVLTHRAFSRRTFSRGVLRAVEFLHRKPPGIYTIQDLYRGE